MKFERSVNLVFAMVGDDIQECPYVVERLTSHVGNLEDRAYPLANELCLSELVDVVKHVARAKEGVECKVKRRVERKIEREKERKGDYKEVDNLPPY